jgi:hypothetical protein
MLDDLAADWREGGAAAIKIMRKERPAEYVRAMLGILPKEILFESAFADVDDATLDEMIERLKQQVITAREEPRLLIDVGVARLEPADGN